MARFQAATPKNVWGAGAAFAHGCVLGRLFGSTKPLSLRLALHKSGLRRSDRKGHNRLYTSATSRSGSTPLTDSNSNASPARTAMLCWLAAALLWFAPLGCRDLVHPDEGRYAEIPREMLATGDWVTPRLDGLEYFEKPPLQYWATAVAYSAFGESNGTSRLWTALLGFLGILMTGFAARRLYDARTAWSAALVLTGSVYYAVMGHFNTLDMGVSFFMCGSLFGFLLAMQEQDGKLRRIFMYLAWVSAALATLSKGLEAVVLPGSVFLLYVGITRDWARFKQLHIFAGLLIYIIIVAPWFMWVTLRNPGFAQFFFIHEHFERFLTTVHHRVAPWWFFIPILVLGLFAFLPQSTRAVAGLFRRDTWRAEPG